MDNVQRRVYIRSIKLPFTTIKDELVAQRRCEIDCSGGIFDFAVTVVHFCFSTILSQNKFKTGIKNCIWYYAEVHNFKLVFNN